MSNAALDKKILLPTIAIVLLTSAPLIFYASSLQGMIQSIYDFTAKSFGWGYILLYLLGGFFVFFIAFSPYGKIKLGGHDQKPVFNNFHWGSMIIAAGHGIGMVNWSMVEPLITNNAAPLGHGANAAYSYEVATAYTFFHWGPYYWVLYLIPCIPIFYFMGVRQVKKQRVSECLTPLFGRKLIDGWFGVCLDVFIIMGLAGGIGSTLATAVQLVSGLYADYFGLPDTQALHLGVLGMFTVITLGSIRKPLSKGMRLLSDMNSILALSLLAIVLIGGATGYFFSLGTNTLGMVLDMFPRVSGWTDPFNASGFPAKWTVFYGAWFLAYGPMMAIFFTGISMGRTLRETIERAQSVDQGEVQYIAPNKKNASIHIDTFHDYEPCILTKYLREIPKFSEELTPEFMRAHNLDILMDVVKELPPLTTNYVPKDSIVREFVGGSIFKY